MASPELVVLRITIVCEPLMRIVYTPARNAGQMKFQRQKARSPGCEQLILSLGYRRYRSDGEDAAIKPAETFVKMRMVVSPLEWRLISRLHLLRRKHAEKEAKEFLIYVLGMAGLSLLPLRPRVLKCLDWVRVRRH